MFNFNNFSARATLATLLVCAAFPASASVITQNTVVAICDLCTVESSINETQRGLISNVDVTINNLNHTWLSDLVITLISPNNTNVILFNNNGGSADNLRSTRFDQSATNSIGAGAAPFTGSFRPYQSLDLFNGQQGFGRWTLRVQDIAGADVGSLNSWTLRVDSVAAAPINVPEPASIALFGLTLAGLAAARRRKQA